MKGVVVTPLSQPPHPACQPGQWWEYAVATASGRGNARGFAPGAKSDALRTAHAALNSLQRMEGAALTRFGGQEIPAARVAGHPKSCACQRCTNEQFKRRVYRAVTARKAETQRSLRARRKRLAKKVRK